MRLFLLFAFVLTVQTGAGAFAAPFNYLSAKNFNYPEKAVFLKKSQALAVVIDSLHFPNCYDPSGYIAVQAMGGTAPYTYTWSHGASGPVQSGLPGGTYTVTVTDAEGDTAQRTIALPADLTAPFADAGPARQVVCSSDSVALEASADGGSNILYAWTGGHIVSGAGTLTPVVDRAGVYVFTVTNTLNGCSTTSSTEVMADIQAPAATVAGGHLTCAQPSLNLNAAYETQHTTFYWEGPGGFYSAAPAPAVASAGVYRFVLTDTLSGCVTRADALVTANQTAPDADISGSGTLTCTQTTVQLTGMSATPNAAFAWTRPNGTTFNGAVLQATATGTYQLRVTDPANGCTTQIPRLVEGNYTVPTASASVSGPLTCVATTVQISGASTNQNVSYTWSGPNGFLSNTQNANVTVPGTYTLAVTFNPSGCTATATAAVTQNTAAPQVTAAGGTKTCSSPLVTLSGSSTTSGVQYAWTGPNNFNSTLQNPTVSVVGNYTLRVTNPQNGCTNSAVAGVSQNTTPPSVTASGGTLTCTTPNLQISTNNQPTGTLFNWTGPNGFSSAAAKPSVNAPGYYYITVTSPSNGCTTATSTYVYGDQMPPFAYGGEDRSLNCFFSTVTLNGNFSSSGSQYTYLWTTLDGNIVAGATTRTPMVDAGGTYTLRVTNNQNGCTSTDEVYVTQQEPVTAAISQVLPVSCAGNADGSATVLAGGGVGSYTYLWSTGSKQAAATGLSAGNYTVTVTDGESCTATASVTIVQLVLDATIGATTQTQPGVNNGTASVAPSGGTAPYTVKWSNNQTAFMITGLAPGAYSVTVTDARGCTLVKSTNVNAAACVLNGALSVVHVTCAGGANGSATANLANFMNPVSYLWSNGATTKTASGLTAGTYKVTATDGTGCSVVLQTTITAPQPLTVNIGIQSEISCPGSNNGALNAGVSGGVQPYTFAWSNGGALSSISNLGAGTYTLTVVDGNGCSSVKNTTLNSPQPLTLTVQTLNSVLCPNDNTGQLSVVAGGGQAPYSYLWSNGQTSAAASNLASGNYTVTVSDNKGCTQSATRQLTPTDAEPPVLTLKNASADLGPNGVVEVSPGLFDNGSYDAACGIASWTVTPTLFSCEQVGTHTVTLTATDKNGNTASATAAVTIQDKLLPELQCPAGQTVGACAPSVSFGAPQVTDNCFVNLQNLKLHTGLPSGSNFPVGVTTQTYRYTDAGGNVGQCTFTVTVEPWADVDVTSSPATCTSACDGSASLIVHTVSGAPAITWSNGQQGLSASGLCVGNYAATVTDGYGCSVMKSGTVDMADVVAPTISCPSNIVVGACQQAVNFDLPAVQDNCDVDPAGIELTAGLPAGSIFPEGVTTQTYTYTDAGGNTATCHFTVTVRPAPMVQIGTQPASCAGACTGTAVVGLAGGFGPFLVQWSNGQSGFAASQLCAGAYTATVTDGTGCSFVSAFNIAEPAVLAIATDAVTPAAGGNGGAIEVSIGGGNAPYNFAWRRNGVLFATTEDVANLTPGEYQLSVTDMKGCTQVSDIIVIQNTVSAGEADILETGISLAPNPAYARTALVFEAPADAPGQVRLLDLTGRMLLEQSFEKSQRRVELDLAGVPAGLCLVEVRMADGRKAVRRLVRG